MLTVLLSWGIILIASCLFGYGIIKVFYGSCRNTMEHFDIFFVCGLLFINVYSQIFSLFYKVSTLACIILFAIGILLMIFLRIKKFLKLEDIIKLLKNVSAIQWVIIFFSTITMVAWTVGYPEHYDTSLYHAQAIRWIEEYGIVPGLGNLHNRFAYNSAFMPLQALFSLKWLLGQSLHTVNGLLCCVFLIYALVTNNIIKCISLQLSDFLKLVVIFYIYINRNFISSPSSDTLAMLLVLYICIKWSELIERNEKNPLPWTFICIICVWAISVKLSVATCILFSIYPIILFISQKKWKGLIVNFAAGFFVAVPWLIRNIIISGYLIYPYPQIDLFHFDWKMLPSILTYDSREIMVWGRKIRDVKLFKEPFWRWVGNWYNSESILFKLLIILGFAAALIILIQLLKNMSKTGKAQMNLLIITCLAGLFLWFFTAPLMRYGSVYVMLPICIVLSDIYKKRKLGKGNTLVIMVMIPVLSIMIAKINNIGEMPFFYQEDYEWKADIELKWEGISIWLPAEGDQISYAQFPSTPYSKILDAIELRGNDLKEGFRVKPDYRELHLNEYGNEW